MAKILLIEDDQLLSATVSDWLTFEHHQVEVVTDGKSGKDRLLCCEYDLVVLDLELPDIGGLEILKEFRAASGRTPVLILTGHKQLTDKTSGLDSGADDYLTKPFHMEELAARIRALLRRPAQIAANVLTARGVRLDPKQYLVTKDGKSIDLLPKEFALLEFLMRHPNQVFSAEALLDKVWPSDSDATSKAIRTCMKRLRKKIDSTDSHPLIKTLYGVGYKLEP
jgi:DNA-binding response OmpR family regulator